MTTRRDINAGDDHRNDEPGGNRHDVAEIRSGASSEHQPCCASRLAPLAIIAVDATRAQRGVRVGEGRARGRTLPPGRPVRSRFSEGPRRPELTGVLEWLMMGAAEDGYGLLESRLSLTVALAHLHQLGRQAMRMCMSGDLKTDIAQALGCSQMQVSRLLRRANDNLRRQLDPQIARP
jgi:DNA-binding CsgD family transcriptional regulator